MRRPRRRKRDGLGWALVAIAFACLIGLGAAGFALRPPPIDPQTLCRTDKPILAHTIILVDATDKLEPRHRKRLRAAIDTERARLAPYDRLTILRIRADQPSEPRLVFSKCLPRDASHSNPLFENPKLAQQRWEEEVGNALKAAAGRAGGGTGGSASPIVQSLFAVGADPDFSAAIPRRRLVLVSDLLEYTPNGFSLYREGATFAAYKISRAGAAAAPDFENISVRITPLDRDDQAARQAEAKRAFWGPFFEEAGVEDIAWDPSP